MKKLITIFTVVLMVSSMVSAADVAGWDAFVIRNGSIAPTITDVAGGYKQFDVSSNSQKAGWGTNSMNGETIGDILSVSITHAPGTPAGIYGPYMNIWVTDGLGGYAVLSNEPSHTAEWGASGPHNTTWDILKNATSWVYEGSTTAGFKLPNGTTSYSVNPSPAGSVPHFTFNDFAGYTIATPLSNWGGTGAPDVLGAAPYTAYGFNWVFGDTADNYSNVYTVKAPTLVPEPATLAILGLGGLLIRRKK